MYSKSSKFLFSLFIVGFLLFCSYVVYQFVLYENYSSGRWETKMCGMSYPAAYREECVFGEECVLDPEWSDSVDENNSGFMGGAPLKTCRPKMNDLMELVFGEEN